MVDRGIGRLLVGASAINSRKAINDETEILQFIADACVSAQQVLGAVDLRSKAASHQRLPELLSALQLLTRYRCDLMADRVRMINRLRDLLTGISPALERASTTPLPRARSCY